MAKAPSPKDPGASDVRVGAAIAGLRKARGMSQTQLAAACGVSFQQVQKYEAGRNRIGIGRLQVIARVFGVQIGDLLAEPADITSTGASLQQLQQQDVAELLEAFAGISSPTMRHLMVDMVRVAARTPQIEQAA